LATKWAALGASAIEGYEADDKKKHLKGNEHMKYQGSPSQDEIDDSLDFLGKRAGLY